MWLSVRVCLRVTSALRKFSITITLRMLGRRAVAIGVYILMVIRVVLSFVSRYVLLSVSSSMCGRGCLVCVWVWWDARAATGLGLGMGLGCG